MDTSNQPSSDSTLSQDAGLLDDVSAEENQGQPTKQVTIDHKTAAPDADTPKERPEWLPENFWKKDESEADIEAMAKSWQDLRKQISQGKHKAPAEGKYDTAAFGDIPEDDPVRQHVTNWAKEYGISQAAFDKLVGDVVSMGTNQSEQVKVSRETERKALGPNADAIIRGMSDWARGLVQKGIWSKDDFEEFKYMGGTARGLSALMKIREAYEGTRIPTQGMQIDGAPSKDDLYAMVKDPKYHSDPAYRSKVERMFQQTFT